ncbi:hypothetical protein H4R27_003982 [Coemansia aciculifera]|nr:hypothetical protein H4R27_003982 [Coemansia aciculifera]
MRLSLVLSASFLVFWISVLGSTSSLLSSWRSTGKALSPRVFELLLWSQIPTYRWSARRRTTSLAAEPSGTKGRVSRSDHRHRAAPARYSDPSNGNKGAAAAATTTLLAPLSRPTALKPAAMLSKWAAAVANEERMGRQTECCHYHPQSKLGGNGSNDSEGQQNQRPVATPPLPAATDSNPYTLSSSSDIDIEIKPLSSQAQLRHHELDAAASLTRDGRRKVSRKLPAAKPMSNLLYRGRTYSSPSNAPVASHMEKDFVDSPPPTAPGADLKVDEELLDRPSLADCVVAPAAARRHSDKLPIRRSWLLTTRSAASAVAPDTLPQHPVALDSADANDVLDAHLPAASALYRKRALALRRASGCPTKTLVAPEELTVSAILPEEPNGITSMIAISTVLIFATFVAF